MATLTTTKAGGIGAMLAGMASDQAGAKKKGSTALQLSAPELQPHIDRWKAAKAQRDTAEAIMTSEEDQIISTAAPMRLEACRRAGRVESTAKINGAISMTQKCQYTKISAEHADTLDQVFGDARPRYFTERLSIALTDEAAADEQVLSDLVEALGPDRFRQVFKVARWLEPTESFHSDYTLRADVQEQARELVSAEIVKPYKPSLRV